MSKVDTVKAVELTGTMMHHRGYALALEHMASVVELPRGQMLAVLEEMRDDAAARCAESSREFEELCGHGPV